MDDQHIIQLYLARDEKAIKETDTRYGRYCFSIARRILYSKEDSEECVDDTWIQTWNSIPPHQPQNLRTYVGKITRNLALNLYEKLTAEKRGGSETDAALDELSEIIPSSYSVEEELNEIWLRTSINTFLRTQKKEDRIVFVQRYWYLMKINEIAKSNHISESNVKMKLLRTRKALAEYLRKEGFDA